MFSIGTTTVHEVLLIK